MTAHVSVVLEGGGGGGGAARAATASDSSSSSKSAAAAAAAERWRRARFAAAIAPGAWMRPDRDALLLEGAGERAGELGRSLPSQLSTRAARTPLLAVCAVCHNHRERASALDAQYMSPVRRSRVGWWQRARRRSAACIHPHLRAQRQCAGIIVGIQMGTSQ